MHRYKQAFNTVCVMPINNYICPGLYCVNIHKIFKLSDCAQARTR